MKLAKKIGMILLGLTVAAAAVATVWLVLAPATPAVVLESESPVVAFSAGVEDLGSSLEEQETLLTALPQQVLADGGDTLYFTVNGSDGVCYKDKNFGADSRLQHEILFGLATRTTDALKILSESCARQGVKLIAVLDIDALSGKAGDMALSEDAFTTQLQASVRTLSGKYALSAVVLAFTQPVTDSSANRAALSGVALQSKVPLGLELPASSTLLSTSETGSALTVARVETEKDAQSVSAFAASAVPVLWKSADPLNFSEAAYYAAAQALPMENFIWGKASAQSDSLSALQAGVSSAALDSLSQLSLKEIPTTLAVSYPAEGDVLYSGAVYVMGTSDPAQPVTVNGSAATQAAGGTFGILVSLEKGENTILVTQGSTTKEVHVTRATSSGGSSPVRDATSALPYGTRVRITPWLCSVLSDPDNEDAIKETAKQGGVAVVNRCVTTVRSGKYTYAYELTSGGWVLAYNCEAVGENLGPWDLERFPVQKQEKDETITLVTGASALAYDNWDEENGVLTVTLANTQNPDGDETISLDSRFCPQVQVVAVDGGVKLTFSTKGEDLLWGYDVTYDEAGNTVLYLKGAPQLDLGSAQPLRGAVIVLDAGHGQDDNGAQGIAGSLGGPAEKDVNLAVALATRARLEQLGATVVMTREDDTFLTLEERSRLAEELHPDLFLAIHHNSVDLVVDATKTTGASAYYFTLQGKLLADSLLGPISSAANRENDGSVWNYFYVNRMTYTPSVLFEYGFMVNPTEYEACCDKTVVLREGLATAEGILAYFKTRLS